MSSLQRTTASSTPASEVTSLYSLAPFASTTSGGFTSREIGPSLLMLVSIGVLGLVLPLLPYWTSALPLVCLAFFTKEWFYLHGGTLTRKVRILFDEKNVLQQFNGRDYALAVVDCITPISKDVVQPVKSGPASILDILLYDQKGLDVQKWYVEHYGGVWSRTQKNWKERVQKKEEGSVKTAMEQ